MKIEIIDDSSFPLDTGNNRIEEIDDIIEVDTCFICNGTPSVTKNIFPEKGKNITLNITSNLAIFKYL